MHVVLDVIIRNKFIIVVLFLLLFISVIGKGKSPSVVFVVLDL